MKTFDIVEVAERIETNNRAIYELCQTLDEKAAAKANALAEYDKALAVAIIKHKDSGKYPVTLIDKIAKGDCYKERASAELAESDYKSTITKIQAREAILNGWQSINRHLQSVDIGD